MATEQPPNDPITYLAQTLQAILERLPAKEEKKKDVHKFFGRPPAYKGTRNENLSSWIFKMERSFSARKFSDSDRISAITDFLEDTALAWFQHLVEEVENGNHQPLDRWNDFATAIKKEFESPNLQQDSRDELRRSSKGIHYRTT